MNWKKTVKRVFLLIAVILIVAVGIVAGKVHQILYPDALITGNGAKKVICVGDSITYGQGVVKSRETDSYPALLAEYLGAEYQVGNYGLCNRTLRAEGEMPYGEEDFAKETLETEADIVIIMLGTNDSKKVNWDAESYEEEYIRFVKRYQEMDSAPEVYIMVPPRVFAETKDEKDCDDTVVKEQIVPIVGRVAEKTGAQLIDLYTVTESHPEWFADGLHPNAEGNRAIAQAVYEQLKQSL